MLKLHGKKLVNMIEVNYVKEIKDKIEQLKELYESTESLELQHKYLWQIEILELVALPQARYYEYNLGVLTEGLHKLHRKLEEQN